MSKNYWLFRTVLYLGVAVFIVAAGLFKSIDTFGKIFSYLLCGYMLFRAFTSFKEYKK